jgi:hypothetical protein
MPKDLMITTALIDALAPDQLLEQTLAVLAANGVY